MPKDFNKCQSGKISHKSGRIGFVPLMSSVLWGEADKTKINLEKRRNLFPP